MNAYFSWLALCFYVVTTMAHAYVPQSFAEVVQIAQTGSATLSSEEIYLWPGSAPGSENVSITEKIEDLSKDPAWITRRITGVSKPSITMFKPKGAGNGVAVVIAPGGGYQRMGFDDEGTDIAKWLNAHGITGFVLKYRLPNEGHANAADVPLQDAQRALRLIRANAARWGIDSTKIGVMGFSSGGHLASMIGTNFNKPVYVVQDHVDSQSARPDFIAPIYPVISTSDQPASEVELNQGGLSEVRRLLLIYRTNTQITRETPPTFMVLADDDRFKLQADGPRFYLGLKKAGVPGALYVFPKGDHGFGVRRDRGPISGWTNLWLDWMSVQGFIK